MSVDLWTELRPVSFSVAYRMLGSVAEAEDVVQEALLRLHQVQESGTQVASPRAFVVTVTTRLAINELKSARVRREQYVGDWLPEPIVTDGRDDPARQAETADSLSLAMLVLLESLSPEQRAALLLHDVFDYPYAQITEILGKNEATVRQLASRARRHVAERRPRFHTTREQRDQLADDVVLTGDGGGKVPALARSVRGRVRVARTLLTWVRIGSRAPGAGWRRADINGEPGALLLDGDGGVLGVWALGFGGGAITSISSVINPEKLVHLGPVGDLVAVLRSTRQSGAALDQKAERA